jgi:hypothetical protein
MEQVWRSTGRDLVAAQQNAVLSEEPRTPPHFNRPVTATLADGTQVRFEFEGPRLLVVSRGGQAALKELCEQLAWLGFSFRPSSSLSGVSLTMPYIEDLVQNLETTDRHVYISFNSISLSDYDLFSEVSSCCWPATFRHPTIVGGYPIQVRDHNELGLQLSFSMTHTLAESQVLTCYDSVTLLKGLSTIITSTCNAERSTT